MKILSERQNKFKKRLILTAKGSHGAKDMNQEQAEEALDFLFSDEATDIQRAAFITAMRFKGSTDVETAGFLNAISKNSYSIQPNVKNLIDCAGAYDGRKKSIHLTCAANFVAVAAGVSIMCHSTTGLPPKRGITTTEVLDALGIPSQLSRQQATKMIEKTGFGFLHSAQFATGVEKFRTVRDQLEYRSLITTCEPFNNPANANKIMFGAAHDHFIEKLAKSAELSGIEHVIGVKGVEGSDEMPVKEVMILEQKKGIIDKLHFSLEEMGFKEAKFNKCLPAEETAKVINDMLENRSEPHKPSVVINAAIRLYLAGCADSVQQGTKIADEMITSGKALSVLKLLQSYRY